MPAAPIAVCPEGAPGWIGRAVEEGGGLVVGADEATGLIWAHPRRAAELEAVLADAPRVRWVQLPWAGVEAFADRHLFDDGRWWTCARGIYAEPVAEHALTLALAGVRDLPARVVATTWGRDGGRTLYDGRVTIVGGGGITRSLLALLAPFRAHVTVVRRHDRPLAGAARVVTPDRLHAVLPGADVVVLALPLTPETVGIIGAPELALLESHAWLVNVARGGHVVTDDLVAALAAGSIGGAALDVVDPEPLPDGHPLWTLPNCILTPHTASSAAMAAPVLSALIRENVRRFGAGEELLGRVDPQAGY